jgi:hypothetical protein
MRDLRKYRICTGINTSTTAKKHIIIGLPNPPSVVMTERRHIIKLNLLFCDIGATH